MLGEMPGTAKLLGFGAAFLVLCGGLVLLPQIDLWASGLFYQRGTGFFLGNWPPFYIIHKDLPIVVASYVAAVLALCATALLLRRPVFGLSARAAVYLVLALALGPGLTVNTIFKDHWGRARPAQTVSFGGDKRFTRAFVPSDQCVRNCSFPAGDPAMGFYLVSAAFLAGTAKRRRAGIAAALVIGSGLGLVRLAQGGHFLSDVVTSGFLVFAISWSLYRLMIASTALEQMAAALRRPSPALRRFAALSLAAALLFAAAYLWIDIPLARLAWETNPGLLALFRFITNFGEGGVYLVPLGIALLAAWLTGRRRWAGRLGFVFSAIALSGIIADILKPVFGRARPVLLLREHLFGFTWIGAHADHWSFPSGHSVTVTALAVALAALYPRLWPLYAAGALLVMASRIILDMHYLSDVVAGAWLGYAVALALTAAMRSQIAPLAPAAATRIATLSDTP